MEQEAVKEGTEDLLLSFDEQYPCWTPAMLALAERDRSAADGLAREGLLEFEKGIYSLSEAGREAFLRMAGEACLPSRPGVTSDRVRTALRGELMLLLDKRHLQRWGVKEYVSPFRFALPHVGGADLLVMDGAVPVWRYPESSVFRRMVEDFPETGAAARSRPMPNAAEVRAWLEANAPGLYEAEFDLLYKSRYDFQAYAKFPPLPADPCGLFNADHFLFSFMPAPVPGNLTQYLEKIGEFQMFLTMLRRLYLPGYVDLDALDQDGVNWLLFAFSDDGDAERCAKLLSPISEALPGTASPLELWSVSLEGLRNYPGGQAETIWDILPFAAHPIYRLT